MRASNIELLRIIAMILIIMHHFSVHGCFPFTPDLTFNKWQCCKSKSALLTSQTCAA